MAGSQECSGHDGSGCIRQKQTVSRSVFPVSGQKRITGKNAIRDRAFNQRMAAEASPKAQLLGRLEWRFRISTETLPV